MRQENIYVYVFANSLWLPRYIKRSHSYKVKVVDPHKVADVIVLVVRGSVFRGFRNILLRGVGKDDLVDVCR